MNSTCQNTYTYICFFSYYCKSLVLFTIPVFALVCRFLFLLCIHPVYGQLHCSIIFCVFTVEVVGITVEVRKFVFFLESNRDISGFTCIEM